MQELERIRRLRGLSQKDLADKARVAEGTVAGIEAARHAPRASTARKLAAALGVEVADLYGEAIPKAHSGAGKERQADRLAPRIRRLEHLGPGDLGEHRRHLEERLADLKVPVTKEEFFAGKDPFEDYAAYLETTDELLATLMVLERIAGRVKQ